MILALDSSAPRGSVALIHEGQVVREISIETPRGRGGALFSALEEILGEGGEIRRVVAGTGPGSYNGIRSALSAAWGIAMAKGVPLIGVSSLLGLSEGGFCAAGDARRGQYYFAHVNAGRFLIEPGLWTKEGLVREIERIDHLPLFVPEPIDFLPQGVVAAPNAARLGLIGAEMEASGKLPEPLYLKSAYITAPSGGSLPP